MPGVARANGELLTPTLTEHRPRDWAPRLPWRLESQVYPAILGGPLAATLVAVANARRLRMERRLVVLMTMVGLVAASAGIAAAALIDGDATRLLLGAAGLAAYGVFFTLQRSPDRVHSAFSPHDDPGADYAPFLLPGVAAIVVSWLMQGAILVAVDRL